ncbi:TIGR04283 family arsenosugar biosynthesis glycosyltransferase [Confluentibacter sediminis]|uniref:TIGR04283 family arsenosugar biosynthesis glycosyltransferase n=1 Tax=Confluentibacter sediminis TaxID=2219045 RepID=UPI000DACE952|nr:TIGR04283 family arsenosugar biosynthesis glycosyltransferase [Confluentibacter sediminis]
MISIIIPILNEEKNIGKLLPYLLDNSNPKNIFEIIVIDGGSTDNSQNIVNDFINSRDSDPSKALYRKANQKGLNTFLKSKNTRPDILLLNSKKGRAKQMNFGAKKAKGKILYFLHADSFPPKNFDQFIINNKKKGHNAGCFRMQFDSKHWWLKLASWFTQFNWKICRGGDQSLFITKALFSDIGGFDENYIVCEDSVIVNELYKRNAFVVINKKLQTSARLYEKHGVFKLQYHFWTIHIKKWLGADAETLYQYYKKHIC